MLLAWLSVVEPGIAPADWFTIINQYGIFGLVAVVLFLSFRSQWKREQDRADRLEAQLMQLHATTADKVIPALVAATQVLEDAQQMLHDLARDRGRT